MLKNIILLLFIVLCTGFIRAETEEQYFQTALDDLEAGRYSSALEAMDQASASNTNNLEYSIYKGYIHYLRGDYRHSADQVRLVLQADPDNLFCRLILADILFREHDLGSSRSLFLELNREVPDLRMIHMRLYELFKHEDRTEAHKHYLSALQLEETDLSRYLPDSGRLEINLPANQNYVILNRSPVAGGEEEIELSQLLESEYSPESGDTNIIIQTTVRKISAPVKRVHFFRSMSSEILSVRIFLSLLVLVFFGLARVFIQARLRRQKGGVFLKTYRK